MPADPSPAPSSPDTGPADSCAEYASLSRRGLLRGALAAGALGTGVVTTQFGSAFVQTAHAATRSAPAVLVVLSMRGAVDGLSLVVPHADPAYYAARPRIAVPAERLLAKDGMFGLHPRLAPLLPLWNAGQMAAVHAVGLPVPNRSHFAAMEAVEDADPGSAARTGWLNRLIGRDAYDNPLQAIQMGDPVVPTALYGPQPVMAATDVAAVSLSAADRWDTSKGRPKSMRTIWADVPGPLGRGARSALQAVGEFGAVHRTPTQPAHGAVYPRSGLGKALASVARTIRGDVGAEVITVDHGSWDMHTNVGTLDGGDMVTKADEWAKAVAAFFTDLGPLASKVTMVTVSEFGRRVAENANRGLDHGHGTVSFLFGAGVKGGYYGTLPTLGTGVNDDVLVTTDYRSVLAEVVSTRFGASVPTVFPGFTPEPVGAMRRP